MSSNDHPAAHTELEIPRKAALASPFLPSNTFPSHASPSAIVETLSSALSALECEFTVVDAATITAACLTVAEEVSFTIRLWRLDAQAVAAPYEVEFVLQRGDELQFSDLFECLRARCAAIDADADAGVNLFAADSDCDSEPFMDATRDLVGRRYAIRQEEAQALLDDLNCVYLHPEALYEVARAVKNHCRHKGNRALFLDTDRAHLLQALQWMLADSDDLARFALFVLLQFARDGADGDAEAAAFVASAFDKSQFSMLLDALQSRESTCRTGFPAFTTTLVTEVRGSALFAH
jgi:hypothetical protein